MWGRGYFPGEIFEEGGEGFQIWLRAETDVLEGGCSGSTSYLRKEIPQQRNGSRQSATTRRDMTREERAIERRGGEFWKKMGAFDKGDGPRGGSLGGGTGTKGDPLWRTTR